MTGPEVHHFADLVAVEKMADAAEVAWAEMAPLVHPTVAQYLRTLTAQVIWLLKENEQMKARLEAYERDNISAHAGMWRRIDGAGGESGG